MEQRTAFNDSFDRRRSTGLKGKVQDLAYSLQLQNEEIGVEKNQLETIKSENLSSSSGLQAQLNDIRRYFQADIQRMEEEFKVQVNLQKSENVRLQQQLTTLKGEKTSIHQQIIALQRRIEEIEEEIGHEWCRSDTSVTTYFFVDLVSAIFRFFSGEPGRWVAFA
eukprot:GEMP01123238.1.p1 GENE.GEMP01123238.1~~GEMP01123238.1.p1  ORF type:complete len:192 (+),score=36.26 GEMP01123238.1:82-576(+)